MTVVLQPDAEILVPSVRQYQVLQELLKDGADNQTIARRLQVSEDTIKSHVKALLAKAGLATRTELVVSCLRGQTVVKVPAGGP